MSPDRPSRSARASVDDRVRNAILARLKSSTASWATSISLTPAAVLHAHLALEFLAAPQDLFADIEERYGFEAGELDKRVFNRAARAIMPNYYGQPASLPVGAVEHYVRQNGERLVLLVIPDEEFLTALEHAAERAREMVAGDIVSDELLNAAAAACKAHGLPYARDGERLFWIGDPAVSEHALVPALRVLSDPRLEGARDEFTDALGKRRAGGNANYKDAVHEAANAVESALKSLLAEYPAVTPPRTQSASALFNSLAAPPHHILPGYVQHLILAAPEIRNFAGGHGQGPTVVSVAPELADVAIASAAGAICLIASRFSPPRS